jgi:uncharacterized protein YndB with AHSA1/START domain
MATPIDVTPDGPHELVLGRLIAAPRAAVWRCWTDPELLPQWFCPKPWGVSEASLDVRPGGASNVVMQGPNGEVVPNPGQYLEVVPGERLVFTDAFVGDWRPSSGKPFMVAEITLADDPSGGTRYVARARHWSAEDTRKHEEMGFHPGWGVATDQLEALARTL